MKKRRLKRWVKVILTIIVIAISTFIYSRTITLGKLASTNNYYEIITIFCWAWLIIGQFIVITSIWGGNNEILTK